MSVTVLCVASLVLGSAPLAGAVFEGGPGTDLPLVHEATYQGGVALGLRFDLTEPGTYRVDMVGHSPRTSNPVSTGFVSFEEDRTYRSGLFVTTFRSMERTIVHADGITDRSHVEAVDGTVEADGRSVQTSEASSSKSKSSCPLMCSVLLHQEDDTSAGSSYHVLWLGGTSQVDVRVFASSAVEHVEIREGQPHVFGDEALEGGDANVQTAERVPAGEPAPTVGAKVLAGASQTRTVEDVFFGQWALVNEKQVCQFSLVLACAGIGLAQSACSQLSPVPCEHARISWEAPDGSGTTASSTFFRGTAPGTYTFTVDRKADAFAAPLVAPTGTEVQAFEHRSYLTAADVPLPPAPE